MTNPNADQTLDEELADAFAEMIARRNGGFATGFVFCGTYVNGDGDEMVVTAHDPEAVLTTRLGCVTLLRRAYDLTMDNYMTDDDE